jgi:hypothetical protein
VHDNDKNVIKMRKREIKKKVVKKGWDNVLSIKIWEVYLYFIYKCEKPNLKNETLRQDANCNA